MVWSGRNLTALTRDMLYHTLSFDYNADGVRIKKSNSDYVDEQWVNDTHNYVLDGSKIIKETIEHKVNSTVTGTDVLYYYYDESGVAGFELNGTVYYYLKNIQGDVMNILNSSGQVVVTYTYDAWGKVLSITGSLASSVGQINPFRYRGYYYDSETGFYYLQTRYYDPEVGRFLNADSIIGANGGIQGYNMFAYCNNNPVMGFDPIGLWMSDIFADPYGFRMLLGAYAGMGGYWGAGGSTAIGPIGGSSITVGSSIDKAAIAGASAVAIAVAATAVAEATVDAIKDILDEAEVIEEDKTKKGYQSAVYYGAHVTGGGLFKYVTGPMSFNEAAIWAISVSNDDNKLYFGKNHSWGLYTKNLNDALKMQFTLGFTSLIPEGNPGEYMHYHPDGRNFNGKIKFHIWYGDIIPLQ